MDASKPGISLAIVLRLFVIIIIKKSMRLQDTQNLGNREIGALGYNLKHTNKIGRKKKIITNYYFSLID
jgi:hypothetical protein